MASTPRGAARSAAATGTPPIDERAAWDLVRLVRPGSCAPVRAHDSRRDVSLQVHPSGAWDTPAPVTEEARQVLDLYLPLRLRADLVVAQAGQSLDGRIATAGGHSHYVTGPEDIRRLHRLRALVDAVIVGAGTIDADDPRLTVREAGGDDPVRVVIDPRGRLDRSRRVFRDGAAPTVVIRGRRNAGASAGADGPGRRPSGGLDAGRRSAGASGGADGPDPAGAPARTGKPPRGTAFINLPADPAGTIDPRDVLAALRARGHRRFLIEGGGVTVSRFLEAGAVDRLHVAVAPLLIGSGRPAFTLAPIATLDEAIRPACRVFRIGEDVLFDLDLRAPVRPGAQAGPGGRR